MEESYIYTVQTVARQERRSRGTAQGGIGSTSHGAIVVGTTDGGQTATGDSHSHPNLTVLNSLDITAEGYLTNDTSGEPQKIKSGYADESGQADRAIEADHATEAAYATAADRAMEADHAAEADHATEATSAMEADHAKEADHATEANHALDADRWKGEAMEDWMDQPVRSVDIVKYAKVLTDEVGAEDYESGLLGHGYRAWMDEEGTTHFEIDKLTVRQSMLVLELLVDKVRSVSGMLVVSPAHGKIAEVETDGAYYRIGFEDGGGNFEVGDYMRCSTLTGTALKSYWVEVQARDENGKVSALTVDFEGTVPEPGDECVQMGSKVPERANMITIMASETGEPAIDVYAGMTRMTTAGCLRTRVGCLDGIEDKYFDDGPKGYGLYSDNAYLKGNFVLKNGQDVATQFAITEKNIESSVAGLRADFCADTSYLDNCTFGAGMNSWDTRNEATFFMLGNRWIWANGTPMAEKGNYATVRSDMGRKAVYIKNKYIEQKQKNYRSLPEMTETNEKGEKKAAAVYLSFFYHCTVGGHLSVTMEGADKSGFEDFEMFGIEEDIAPTEGYVTMNREGLWNGTGDFRLSFSGEIYVYMLVLSTDKVNALAQKYKTLFEQSERLVKISAAVFDKDEKMLAETGLLVTSQLAGLYAINSSGSLVSMVGVGVQGIKIKAENITLEGVVTANENFKIRLDGSIEARNGKFTGEIEAESGKIGGWEITDTGIVSGKFEDTGSSGTQEGMTYLNKDGTIGGDLLNVGVRHGSIRASMWASPVLEWDYGTEYMRLNYIKMNGIVGCPFPETSGIMVGSVGNLAFTMQGSSIIVQPSYMEGNSALGTIQDVYYEDLPRDLERYSGVTLRIFNPAYRHVGWKANTAILRYKLNEEDTEYTAFMGKYEGTDLKIPPGKMVVITGVREAIAETAAGNDVLKWYVELTS